MFETLAKGFRSAKQRLSGVAELDDDIIEEALRDVRMSLLEADVEFSVTKRFLERVREAARGERVQLKAKSQEYGVKTITPDQAFVKICQDELSNMMGPVDTSMRWAKKGPTGIMMVGLQGSGKTTTTGKLARLLSERDGKKPLLVAADVYRPAAVDQLRTLGERLGMPVFHAEGESPVVICKRAEARALEAGCDVILYDTAGRLTIDDQLMQELEDIDREAKPANIFLVLDAMTGQDAVNTADNFNKRLDLDGVILTKLDGDARGGAALSVKEVTGKPIKYLGMGEGMDKLEEFRPEGLASRILGMGDIVGLVQDFEKVVDAEKAEEDAVRMLKGKFDMQDFLEQIRMIQKMGSLKDLFDKLPFFPEGLPDGVSLDDRELTKIEAMISSMTKEERRNPSVFVATSWEEITAQTGKKAKRRRADYNPERVRRIARGAGRKEDEVKELLQKFATMRQMMVQLGASTGLMGKIPGLKQFGQMKKLAGMDLGSLMGGGGAGMPGLPAMGGGGGGMPGMPGMPGMQMPGLPPGFTPPGTPSAGPAARPKADRGKKRDKRKQAKAARKRSRKRK
ncbi:signal recognition particle protein [Haliangium ochraceum]|uniref:Signal recognition particle protein n=1 Tax=Haliangium ochraceum (strain DSM 14365 / JCM 11303 / SMP-2) TaxID=502025 RepID=D0LW21_HALO1|nr:signal recognition particle protein [Haliangium ochraceum]ACY15953.1 signal recognition particle protein [Haliangium ochraceum DSM 14365]